VPSESTRRDLVDVVGLPPARVHLTPLGVPLDPPDPAGIAAREAIRRRYELPPRYLLYAGTIDRRKDHATLLEALARLDPAIPLVLTGTLIRGRTDFPERVERLGLGGRVRFLGYVPDADLPALYEGAAVFVYPSFYEGFGLPVLEAMACGAPVVTYNVTSLPELVGDAGVLLDPPWTADALAEAIRRVLGDPAWAQTLRARGRERVKHFDWSETARRTAAIYEAVCAGSS
jgi:glycosyltransferase involved in cell wall biosynthesis